MAIALRDLAAGDLALLTRWMQARHLRPFYVRPDEVVSERRVTAKYTPRLGGSSTVSGMIASHGGHPFGYLQWYLNRDVAEYGRDVIGQSRGVSIDYFIGDPAMLGRGLGAAMLDALVLDLAPRLAPADRVFHLGHDVENGRAIACSGRAGFRHAAQFVEDGR
ncbi:MAG: GNAT family N-acetyltransferase, partial [Pseudomonadota bacterium]